MCLYLYLCVYLSVSTCMCRACVYVSVPVPVPLPVPVSVSVSVSVSAFPCLWQLGAPLARQLLKADGTVAVCHSGTDAAQVGIDFASCLAGFCLVLACMPKARLGSAWALEGTAEASAMHDTRAL